MNDAANPENRRAIWAPWRMDYILQPKAEGCFLCDAAATPGDARETLVVCRRGPVFLVLNRYPYNNGHLMVCPVRHVQDLSDLNAEERLGLMNLAEEAIRALRWRMAPRGFNLGINMGHVAGAGLDSHLHLHIVPRWDGDTNFMPVIADAKVIPQTLTETWETLRSVLEPA